MNGSHIVAIAFAFVFTACAPQQQIVNLSSKFDPAEAKFILTDGNATITGQAFLRQSGGGVVTCAGSTVYLIPRTKYASERMQHLYGGTLGGVNYGSNSKSVPDYFVFTELTRQTQCDAQGNFEFSSVPSGKFYVSTNVEWVVARARQGGGDYEACRCYPGRESNCAAYVLV